MKTTLIKLVYKQVIDATSNSAFEKRVFDASYEEFLLKSQTYNMDGKCKTFTELKARDGRANSLHYKLSFAVGQFIDRLDNVIPGLKDNLDNTLQFDLPRFELLESDLTEKTKHKVAINYMTPTLVLCNAIGEYLVLAKQPSSNEEPMETFMIKLQPNLSIASYQEHDQAVHYTSMPVHTNN